MRKGTRLSDKANTSELLINSVMRNKPKVLIGLSQKGKWWVNPLRYRITGTFNHRKKDRA